MPIDAILFDCDGTLVDSETLANRVIAERLRELGFDWTFADVTRRFTGLRLAACMAIVTRESGRALPADFEPDVRARMDAAFEAHLLPIDGAADLLRALRLPTCVATGGPRAKAERNLERTGLLPWFAGRVYSSYDVGSWKPEPGLFLHAAAALGVAPERCAVVEDSVPGAQAGLAAGMRVFVRAEGVDGHALDGEVVRFGNLRELVPLLGMLGPGVRDGRAGQRPSGGS